MKDHFYKNHFYKNPYYLGIDGGGTGTRAALADTQGRILAVARAGSANRNHYTREQVRTALQEVLHQALVPMPPNGDLAGILLGLSGISTEADKRDIQAILRGIPEASRAARITVANDTVAALTGGLSGRPGLALIAGTGSVCLGRNARGDQHLCGG